LHHFDISAFVTAATGVLGLVSVCLLIFGRLGSGTIVAFLAAGVLIDQIRDIPPETTLAVREFAESGVILLLFLIGIEITPIQLRRLGKDAALLGLPQIGLCVGLIALYIGLTYAGWTGALVIGLGFALSSTVVVMQLLNERGELDTAWGRKAFAILLAQDLAVVPFMLIISFLASGDRGKPPGSGDLVWATLRGVVLIGGIVVFGRFVLTRILAVATRQRNTPAFVCLTFLGVLVAALAADKAGLSMALGAFLLGVTLSMSPSGHRIADIVEPVKSTLLALFFLSVGLSIDVPTIAAHYPGLLLNTVLILAIKIGVILLIGVALRLRWGDALQLASALAQCGEFGFVLFGAAQVAGLLSPELAALGSVLIIFSMLATPFLMRTGAHFARSMTR
jgi:glutathione-regulated potassium-efflux system ancillary protein KefC